MRGVSVSIEAGKKNAMELSNVVTKRASEALENSKIGRSFRRMPR